MTKVFFIFITAFVSTTAVCAQENNVYKKNLSLAESYFNQGVLERYYNSSNINFSDETIEQIKLAEYFAYSMQERSEEQMRKFVAIVKGDKSFLDKNKKDFSIVETEYTKIIMEIEVTLHEKLLNLKQ